MTLKRCDVCGKEVDPRMNFVVRVFAPDNEHRKLDLCASCVGPVLNLLEPKRGE